jgi:hypothetical protein
MIACLNVKEAISHEPLVGYRKIVEFNDSYC